MKSEDMDRVDPASLADLMDSGGDRDELWETDELGAILEHQLAAELAFDLYGADPAGRDELSKLCVSQGGPPIRTFRDLFAHPRPPVELLELTHQFAKTCRSRSDSPLPAEIATALYFASIVAARIKRNRLITKLDEATLRHGLEWALQQSWLDASLRTLLQQGRQAIQTTSSENDA